MRADAGRLEELTARLVGVPSHEEADAVQELLAALFEDAGFDVALEEVDPGRSNLVAVRGDGGPFVCSHADVHPPHAHPDAFRCRREGDVLVGRGVLDAKGQLAALVAAAETVPDAPLRVLVTPDEESTGNGSERLDRPERFAGPDGGIVLEPTELRVCTAQAGALDLVLQASTEGGHAYAEGLSALDVLDGALDALRTCSFLHVRHPLLPTPVPRVGVLRSGEHLWRRPARGRAEVALPLHPGVDPDAAQAQVAEVLEALRVAWKGAGAEIAWDVTDLSEPIEVPDDLGIVARLARAGVEATPAGMPSWTDAGNLLVHHGIACVVFGAGTIGPAHSDREWVRLADLVRLAEILVGVLS